MNKQSRWRSPLAWSSLFALIIFVLKQYFDVEIENVDKLVELVLIAMGGIGIFNNPEKKDVF